MLVIGLIIETAATLFLGMLGGKALRFQLLSY